MDIVEAFDTKNKCYQSGAPQHNAAAWEAES